LRLDKFLKLTGLCRRRTVAKEMCQRGRVSINGRPAKPGTAVDPGDRLQLDFGTRKIEVEVKQLPERPVPREEREDFVAIIRRIYVP